MDILEHLRGLFEYDDWANRRTIAALETCPSDRSRRVLAHILITKQEYFERLAGKDSTGCDFWPDLNLEQCRNLAATTNSNYATLLNDSDESGLELIAKYKTSEGVPQANTFRDLLTHVLLHASVHRGNIVLKMREEGFEPPKIDYILYLRRK
ncbi:MAG: DinB family protein [Acidobacteriota bacterium]